MSDNIFNNLPNNLIMKIIKINTERERDEKYKNNYNDFVNNFKNRVNGDSGEYYSNDITYNWLYRLETFIFNQDINNYKDEKYLLGLPIRHIKEVIDDGRVDNY